MLASKWDCCVAFGNAGQQVGMLSGIWECVGQQAGVPAASANCAEANDRECPEFCVSAESRGYELGSPASDEPDGFNRHRSTQVQATVSFRGVAPAAKVSVLTKRIDPHPPLGRFFSLLPNA